ncbi:hypothetical protein PS9374_04478 [Planomonospora sphaerica]|uniref:Uncharacterized protein n=1 Tax=Planomonospora sphaerica TaxID=161355 RepID=A0A161MCB8_9ACTN|nr:MULTISPECIES: hypothetical protein [Planomonospora]GAT68813.1 hypothetical protein PS9374_04478 [Planomonospora sphaerica]GGL55087.1 hypothetical protein GCM10014719_65480 [Planomonospora parontospora subsp. antibiotica]GII19774.1 hypothetical protein Ppa05_65000 [Planomonospora parontospora subsp. antibiotica]
MNDNRGLWMAVILITAVVIGGLGGGLVSAMQGGGPAGMILTGAAGFAGTVMLLLAIAHFLIRS